MARRPEFYFDEKTGYYRKRVKLQSGTYKDVRAKVKRNCVPSSTTWRPPSGWVSSWMIKPLLPSFWRSGM